MTYPIILDSWEGSLDIDEPVLLPHVAGVIPRLNHITGTMHKDELFDQQWEQAASFQVRFPYFVYSPWYSGRDNFGWFEAFAPDGVKRFAVDVEVKRDGYSAVEYAANVSGFLNLAQQAGYKPVIYTGQWFVQYLSTWPPNADYWWARYPFYLYPPQSQSITWEELKSKLDQLVWNPSAIGPCPLWQCSADRYKLPGLCGRVADVIVWKTSTDDLLAWVGMEAPRRSWAVEIDAWARSKGYTGVGPNE